MEKNDLAAEVPHIAEWGESSASAGWKFMT